jgi:hypothetical protein
MSNQVRCCLTWGADAHTPTQLRSRGRAPAAARGEPTSEWDDILFEGSGEKWRPEATTSGKHFLTCRLIGAQSSPGSRIAHDKLPIFEAFGTIVGAAPVAYKTPLLGIGGRSWLDDYGPIV